VRDASQWLVSRCCTTLFVSALKNCEIFVYFSFSPHSDFRHLHAFPTRRSSDLHTHSEPFESEGTRAAKRYVNGNLGFRNLLGARRGLRGQFSVQFDNRFSGRGGGWGGVASVLKNLLSD